MPRFFTDLKPVAGYVTISGEDARHIAKSLRMQPGENLTVCDGEGMDHSCVLEAVSAESITARILESCPSVGEPNTAVVLFMALPKADKMELIIQKCTELGVAEIVPVITSRCVSRPDAKALAKKNERWSKIAEEAAKQSGRGRIPRVRETMTFADALREAAKADTPLFLYEAEREQSFRAALMQREAGRVSIFVGPEGGFAEEEAQAAREAGLIRVSLGPRILRCETAPLAALSVIMYQTNNL